MDSIFTNMTAPYSALDSYLYDAVIADGVMQMVDAPVKEFLGKVSKGGAVLDVGCGGGQLVRHLAALRPDLKLTGLDLSKEQVARAAKRSGALDGRAAFMPRFVQGSALEIPFGDGEFDFVVSVASIKHWPDQTKGLRECIRVLKPGGTLLVAEADRACTLDSARAFVSHWHIPSAFRPLALMGFRTFVAGQALDRFDAEALLVGLPLKDAEVVVRRDLAALFLTGKRPAKRKKARAPKRAARAAAPAAG